MDQTKTQLNHPNIEDEPRSNLVRMTEIKSPGLLFSLRRKSQDPSAILTQMNQREVKSEECLSQLRRPCLCSDILACDDNSFQLYFYSTYFEQHQKCDGIQKNKQDLKISLSKSGEDLISDYRIMKKCGCEKPLFVITDLEMGSDKLDGIETSKELRDQGFSGPIVMNSSHSMFSLPEEKSKIDNLIENKVIDYYVSKQNPSSFNTTVQNLMK